MVLQSVDLNLDKLWQYHSDFATSVFAWVSHAVVDTILRLAVSVWRSNLPTRDQCDVCERFILQWIDKAFVSCFFKQSSRFGFANQ